MALYRIDTKYFEVVNTDDDALTLPEPVKNRWLPVADCAGHLAAGHTPLRIRALSALEFANVDTAEGASRTALLGYAEAGCHPDDLPVLRSLPWQYHVSLGTLVHEVSLVPLGRAK